MSKNDDYIIAQQVARLRHTKTNYDKHIDLMYDADGNPTQLRRHVNSVLGKIVKGELSKKYIGGLRSEIKLAQADIIKANRMKKIANRKAQMPSVAKQQEMLRMGLDMYYRKQAKKFLGCIHMKEKQLRKLTKNILPKP